MFSGAAGFFLFVILTVILATVLSFILHYVGHYIPVLRKIPVFLLFIIVFLALMLLEAYGLPLRPFYQWFFGGLANLVGG
ncbi:MAG: hypothetical protein V5A88_09025 [Candidatus Thermoplasmatota archaeon]